FWSAWSNNELAFHYLERAGGFAVARGVTLALLGGLMAWALVMRPTAPSATRLCMRAALLLSPVLHPWYLGWALAYEPLSPSGPGLLLPLTAVLTYGVLATPAAGRDFHLSLAGRWVEYGAPLLLAILLALEKRRDTQRLRPAR